MIQETLNSLDNIVFIALFVSFVLGIIIFPFSIRLLKKMQFGQYVRDEGPKSHLKKSGTPTMAGVAIVLIVVVTGAIFMFIPGYSATGTVLIFTVLFGIIGMLDDVLKISKRQSEGLKAWQKMLLQILVCAALICFIAFGTDKGTTILVPFIGYVNIGGWFYPLAAFAVLGTVNGANFTDGLDGLCTQVSAVICGFFFLAAVMLTSGVTPAVLAMLGALLAFLLFNTYPAKVFMGDSGSLAIGGFAATCALVLQMPLFLIMAAFIYLIEILSVIIQVGYFKITHGKRIFKMAPLHHHFELCGASETQVVSAFTVVTMLLCALSYLGLYFALA